MEYNKKFLIILLQLQTHLMKKHDLSLFSKVTDLISVDYSVVEVEVCMSSEHADYLMSDQVLCSCCIYHYLVYQKVIPILYILLLMTIYTVIIFYPVMKCNSWR